MQTSRCALVGVDEDPENLEALFQQLAMILADALVIDVRSTEEDTAAAWRLPSCGILARVFSQSSSVVEASDCQPNGGGGIRYRLVTL
jgi:hypothetical protein